ncbi:hypothetical protein HU200_035920 [Digitaria exilis]|uniref:Uncharacterized protein n=1 Tax=Digitaria exilis TaxID=1010633 RepID=A0A835BHD5_9POAL|nr:hypothetical protein HU200_035920 [Digitaria exilis]
MAGGVPGYEGCPSYTYDVVDFVGELFVLGAACGSAFHFVKGLRASPIGSGAHRLAGAVRAVGANGPRVAGKFGAYCASFSAIEGAVPVARGREDIHRRHRRHVGLARHAPGSGRRRRPRRGGVRAPRRHGVLGC